MVTSLNNKVSGVTYFDAGDYNNGKASSITDAMTQIFNSLTILPSKTNTIYLIRFAYAGDYVMIGYKYISGQKYYGTLFGCNYYQNTLHTLSCNNGTFTYKAIT